MGVYRGCSREAPRTIPSAPTEIGIRVRGVRFTQCMLTRDHLPSTLSHGTPDDTSRTLCRGSLSLLRICTT